MNQNPVEQSRSIPANFQRSQNNDIGRSEVLNGRQISKPAANRWHNLISTNLVIALGSRVQRATNEIYVADMKVQVGKNSVCFPDVVVVNGEPAFSEGQGDVLQNPTVVIEIFSHASSTSDRAHKLEGFLATPSIKECLLVNENDMRVEHYARQNSKQWIYRIYNERDDVISLESLNCKMSLAEVYASVKNGDAKLSSKAVN